MDAQTFITADINEAAILKFQQFHFLEARAVDGLIYFVFAGAQSTAEATLQQHLDGKLRGSTRDLFDSIRWARDVIFRTRRRHGLMREVRT